MARIRRSERRRAPDVSPPGLDTDPGRVAASVRIPAEAALGEAVDLAEPPEPVFAGCGPEAYRVRMATDDPVWARPLIARLSPDAVLAREAAWIDRVRAAGFPAPEVVGDGCRGALVFREPAGTNLAERMITDMAALPRLLADFGRLHASLHALPAAIAPEEHSAAPSLSSPADGDGGTADVAAGLDDPGIGDPRLAAQVDWLVGHTPPPGEPVVCHGDLHPAHVYVDGGAAVAVNWTGAGLADPERDVAATLTGFWTAPLYVDSAVQRRLLKMVRDSLASAYLAAYGDAAVRPLDDTRLRYWQAAHLCRIAAGIARHEARGATGPWDTAAHVAQPATALDELDREFWRLAAS